MIKVGTVFTIELVENGQILKSKLLDQEGDILLIDFPVNDETGKTVFLPDHTEMNVVYLSEEKKRFKFRTKVLGKKKDVVPMIMLKKPDTIEEAQRRQFVRIKTSIDVAIHPLKNEFAPFAAVTGDVSAGGLSIIIPKNKDLPLHVEILIYLVLTYTDDSIEYLKITGRPLRIEEKKHRKSVSIEFVDVDEKIRQKLLRFCYEQQLLLRRKQFFPE